MASSADPTLQSIYTARARIAPHVLRTPIVRVGRVLGADNDFALKCEFMQSTGAFKIRGAANRLLTLPAGGRARGVITVSTGNHGRAVTAIASRLGTRATICISTLVPPYKVRMLKASGADVRIIGDDQDQALASAREIAVEEGLTFIPPFDDPEIIAGQGTVGLELLEDLPNLSCVVVGVGGGSLISGIAVAMKAVNPAIRVIGVQMDRNPVMYHSVKAGKPIEMEELPTLADALAGSIFQDNTWTLRFVRDLVDEIVLVSEREIADAMVRTLRDAHYVLEGAGAVGVAAMLAGKVRCGSDDEVAVIASGGSVAVENIASMMALGRQP